MRLLLVRASLIAAGWWACPAVANDFGFSEALGRALQIDPQFQADLLARDASQQRALQARAGLLPRVQLTLNTVGNDSTIHNVPNAADGGQRFLSTGATLTALQPLVNAAATADAELGRVQAAMGDLTLKKARADALLRAAVAYGDVLAAQDAVHAVLQEQALVEQQMLAVQASMPSGPAKQAELQALRARVDALSVQLQVESHALRVRRQALQTLAGPLPAQLPPVPERACVPDDRWLDDWISDPRTAIQGLEAQVLALAVDAADRQWEAARAGHRPTVDLFASYSHSKGLPLYPDGQTRGLAVGVQLNLPLYAGGAASSKVREADLLRRKSRQDWLQARNVHLQAVVGAVYSLRSLRVQLAGQQVQRQAIEWPVKGDTDQSEEPSSGDAWFRRFQRLALDRDLQRLRHELLVGGWRLQALLGAQTPEALRVVCGHPAAP